MNYVEEQAEPGDLVISVSPWVQLIVDYYSKRNDITKLPFEFDNQIYWATFNYGGTFRLNEIDALLPQHSQIWLVARKAMPPNQDLLDKLSESFPFQETKNIPGTIIHKFSQQK